MLLLLLLLFFQKRPKAEGYPDEATTLYKAVSVSEFVMSEKHLTLLAECSKLEFDRRSDVFSRHPLTTDEIRTLCDDVKVLGPTELRQLVRITDCVRLAVSVFCQTMWYRTMRYICVVNGPLTVYLIMWHVNLFVFVKYRGV